MANSTLTKGSAVEVSNDEPDFHGAWYVATIVDQVQTSPTKNRTPKLISYLVKYDTLLLKQQDDSFQPLVEFVDPSFVRPSPPPNIRRNNATDAEAAAEGHGNGDGDFEVDDVIDAYHKDGWWIGVVKGAIVIEGELKKYTVSFENSHEEFEFERCKLRFHVDWIDCRWMIPPKKTPEQLLGDRNATHDAPSGLITPSKRVRITETVGPSRSAKKNSRSRKRCESNSAADNSRRRRLQRSAGGKGTTKVSASFLKTSKSGDIHQNSTPEIIITQPRESENGTKRGRPPKLAVKKPIGLLQGGSCLSPPDQHGNSASQTGAGTTTDGDYQQDWPFIKRSPFWDTIELYSQKPHFSPLKTEKEAYREGLAIGLTVTFGNLVHELLDLQPNDPVDILNNSLETLCELETHGFDVGPIGGRLNELLSLKSKVCQHEDMRKEVEKELEKCKHEKSVMEKEIEELKVQMRVLKLKTVQAGTMRKLKEGQATRLRSNLVLVCNQISEWKLAFGKLVAAPL